MCYTTCGGPAGLGPLGRTPCGPSASSPAFHPPLMKKPRIELVRCHHGHESPRAQWDCPVCAQILRARVLKAVVGDSKSCFDLQTAMLAALYPRCEPLERAEYAEQELRYLNRKGYP